MTKIAPGVRNPAVAGTFYPDASTELASVVDGYLAVARYVGSSPKALVVPHAGYVYSGPVAGSAYATLASLREVISRVVVLGPAHRVAVDGIAVPGASTFLTPLGAVEVDSDARAQALSLGGVHLDDAAHAFEHSLELQLPFLQRALHHFRVLPLAVGRTSSETVAAALDALWGGPETLVVVSTDLSHYLDYETAAERDRRTARAVVELDADGIGEHDACGAVALRGLLKIALRRRLEARLLDLRSSGDTEGSRDRVVGYGAFGFWEPVT